MNITDQDKNGSTPLHWACFSCSEVALIYILAWIKPEDLTIQDIHGYTVLHLSIKSSAQLKNCRPTRALLYRGAVKDVTDKQGKRPIDLALELPSTTVSKELITYLN